MIERHFGEIGKTGGVNKKHRFPCTSSGELVPIPRISHSNLIMHIRQYRVFIDVDDSAVIHQELRSLWTRGELNPLASFLKIDYSTRCG
mgnify:CR=1 FL=1